MKLLIGVPYTSDRDPPNQEALDALDKCGMDWKLVIQTGYGVDMQRNRIVVKAITGGYDRLLMLDADTLPSPDALKNLMEHDADVCMGWYLNRHSNDNQQTCQFKLKQGWNRFEADYLRGKRDAGTYTLRIKGGGMGCCLFNVKIFDAIFFPWFVWRDVKFDRRALLFMAFNELRKCPVALCCGALFSFYGWCVSGAFD